MISQQILAGNWNEVRGRLKEKWGKLTDDDLRVFNGNVDQLIGRIQQKTGETREIIEEYLDELAEEGSDLLGAAREKMEETASHVADGVRQGYEGFKQGLSEAERVVAERPGQSLAVAFGVGLVAGVGLSLILRDRPRETAMAHGRRQNRNRGNGPFRDPRRPRPTARHHGH